MDDRFFPFGTRLAKLREHRANGTSPTGGEAVIDPRSLSKTHAESFETLAHFTEEALMMVSPEATAVYWLLAIVVPLGLASAWAARLSHGARCERPCQWIFLALLVVVAVSTGLSLRLEPAYWLISAGAFSAMVLTVLCDFRGASRIHAW